MKFLLVSLMYLCHHGYSMGENEEVLKPTIKSVHIKSDIAFRFSTTHVKSRLANENQNATEATFHVTLPKTAFMTNFSMNIDGNIIHGEVKEKEKAKAQYNKAVSLGQSAGYVAATARESNNFEVTVNVEAGREVTFDLEYQEVLQRRLGYYEHLINIDPGQVVPDLQVEVNINESRPLTKLKVPPIRKDDAKDQGDKVHPDAHITKTGVNSASISYKPSEEKQKADSDKGISGQFVVQYDVQRALDGGEIHVVKGYFVHALAPEGLPPMPKNILFILDVSGSMMGRKIAQVKDAMRTILDDVRHDDTFNLMTFDDKFTFWKKDLQKVNDASIQEAKGFVTKMRARGMTDINGAISRGISFLDRQEASDKERPSIIIFLTDGDPTQGETDTGKIQENIRNLNDEKYTLLSLGFGENLNFNFLKQLSLQNGGLARKIYEASDASIQLKNFYREVSIPLLSDVNIKYKIQGGELSKVTKHEYKTFFSGGEFMIAGKINQPERPLPCWVSPCLYGRSSMGDFVICPPGPIRPPITPGPTPGWVPETGLAAHVERMWAYLTIRELLERELRETNDTIKEEVRKEALEMSLKFKFVTPLTSMVVTLPEEPNATLGELRDSANKNSYSMGSMVGRKYGLQGMPWGGASGPAGLPRLHARPGMGRGSAGPPGGLPGGIQHSVRRGYPIDLDDDGPESATVAPQTMASPTTPPAPVLGKPSMVIRLQSGVVCLSWPQMSQSAHTIIKDQGVEIQVTHGRRGASQSIMVKTNMGTSLITPSQMLLGSQLRPWSQPYTGNNVTVTGNTVSFELLTGFKMAVHKVNSELVFDFIETSGLSHSVTGILKHTHSWVLRITRNGNGTLLTPTPKGIKQFVTSSASAAGITCHAAAKDVFDVTRHSRRA